MNDPRPPFGPLFVPVDGLPAAKTTASGIALPDLSWAAATLGLVPQTDGWLDTAVRAYLIASEYLGPIEHIRGHEFDPEAWIDVLLRLYPAEDYVLMLAQLNRTVRFPAAVVQFQQRFLGNASAQVRVAVGAALAGGVDGQPRVFLARQPLLRAMRLVLASEVPQGPPDGRVAAYLSGVDLLSAAVLLVHLAADTMRLQRPEGEPLLGGVAESLAGELICNQIFNEPHDVGGLFSRTWALWTDHGANLKRGNLDKAPLDLLEEATGLKFEEILALGFGYWAMTTADRVNGPLLANAFTVSKLPKETVERFLELFAVSIDELKTGLAECEKPWQMLPLQTRPLLRRGDEVVILDEPFFLEAITAGLYFRVFAHFDNGGGQKEWGPWASAYAEMVEAHGEGLVEACAPTAVTGPSSFFTEEDIKKAFTTGKKSTPPNTDANIDFGFAVVLVEIVNKAMNLAARTGDLAAIKADIEQAVLKKTVQLDGTAELLRRDPQPAASPLTNPAQRVFPVVLCSNHFPLNPVTRNYIEERLQKEGLLQHPSVQRLAIIDLDDLESLVCLAKAGYLLPQVLSEWLSGDYGKGSFSIYMSAAFGGQQIPRPSLVADSLQAVLGAILPLLNIKEDD